MIAGKIETIIVINIEHIDMIIIEFMFISDGILLKKYISDTSKILPTRITNVSHSKQKKLAKEIKKAQILGLL